jgi:hypothetical protein
VPWRWATAAYGISSLQDMLLKNASLQSVLLERQSLAGSGSCAVQYTVHVLICSIKPHNGSAAYYIPAAAVCTCH